MRPSNPWYEANISAFMHQHADILSQDVLHHDSHPIHAFRRKRDEIVKSLTADLLQQRYYPTDLKTYMSSNGKEGQVIAYKDRMVERWMIKMIRPCYKHIIHPRCYHRYGPSGCRKAFTYLKSHLRQRKYTYVCRLDIKSFYASIWHHILIKQLKKTFSDPKLLVLFERLITRYVLTSRGYMNPDKGIPIQSSLSQFLSCLYLKPLDEAFDQMDLCYVRYMDDIVILSRSYSQFKRVRKKIRVVLKELKLKLSWRKSYMGPMRDFHYLGSMIRVTPSSDCHQSQSESKLHERSLVKARNRVLGSASKGYATQREKQYLKLWSQWWSKANGTTPLSCLKQLEEWSHNERLSLCTLAVILSDP